MVDSHYPGSGCNSKNTRTSELRIRAVLNEGDAQAFFHCDAPTAVRTLV
jgi:hypothetical protein